MIHLKGKIPTRVLETYRAVGPIGTPGEGTAKIPMSTPNFDGNRTPKANVLTERLQKNGGFHWGLYGSPLVARLPDGTMATYDGGHRIGMLQQLFPEMEHFPGTIIDVKDDAEISRLFHRVNGSAASFVNAEQRFINEVKGEEDGISQYINVLSKSNVVIMDSTTNFVPTNATSLKWKAKIRPIEEMTDRNKEDAVWALSLFVAAWDKYSRPSSTGNEVTGQIAKALHFIKEVYASHFEDETMLAHFEDWFVSAVSFDPSIGSWLFRENKHDRMEKRHYGTAYGIMQKYCSYARNTIINRAPKIEPIKSAYFAYDERQKSKAKVAVAA